MRDGGVGGRACCVDSSTSYSLIFLMVRANNQLLQSPYLLEGTRNEDTKTFHKFITRTKMNVSGVFPLDTAIVIWLGYKKTQGKCTQLKLVRGIYHLSRVSRDRWKKKCTRGSLKNIWMNLNQSLEHCHMLLGAPLLSQGAQSRRIPQLHSRSSHRPYTGPCKRKSTLPTINSLCAGLVGDANTHYTCLTLTLNS